MLELLSAALLNGTSDLKVSVVSYVKSRNQNDIQNLIPNIQTPFTEGQCRDVVESIENSIRPLTANGPTLATDTYSDATMKMILPLITKDRQTTIVTIAGTVSNGVFDNPDSSTYVPGNIAKAISNIEQAVGNPSLVKFFSAGYFGSAIGLNEATRINYQTEIEALAKGNIYRSVLDEDQSKLFLELVNRLHSEGILCEDQSK